MMLTGTLHTFIQYFRTFADAHPSVKFFMFGSVEKGMAFARSLPDFDYPFLWLEEPVIVTQDNDAAHVNDRFRVGVSVLQIAPLDDNEAQIDAYALGLQIVTDLQHKLRKDRKKGLIHTDLLGQRKEPISQLWADGHYGFRLEFEFDMNINANVY
ncbi:hypothetical protein LX87_04084 [Larkinella arboricola]|uniref:Uncharacterized protein n=1 Tax=Larkinella arboricola TaxID=643671 RepID=A0A327WQG2_LARAB|nr:hypothetical protein [Larkinella arboricola]RAJ94199.1 hypothetical protein LX87_04084 [Larkinella arboricola]